MKNINYTLMQNERNEFAIIINPIKENGDIQFFSINDKDLIMEINCQQFSLLDFFKNHKNIKDFILVEYGAYGLVRERKIKLS